MFQVLDALLIRASTHPVTFDLPPWPDVTGEIRFDDVSGWLTAVWGRQDLAAAITAASPTLADQVERIRAGQCHDVRQLRRTVASTARYLLRATGRSTPFALFAGVAPALLGGKPAVRWGQLHQPVLRADGAWLAGVIALLEECPALLRRLPVMLNDLAEVREDRVIVPFARPPATQGRPGAAPAPVDVSVRLTAAVAAVTTYARRPIVVVDLITKLCIDFPSCSASVAEAAIARLVRTGVLLTALRPPMTATDGLAHVLAQLTAVEAEAIPELTDTVQALMTIGDQIRSSRHGSTAPSGGFHRALVERMNAVRVGVSQPAAVDLRLDATITLPDTLVKHAREAAAVLTRLTPYPRGLPAWREYHAAFLERYGPGAVVPLLDVVNPEIGLGFPATYRGSDRTVSAAPLSERDRHLLRLAQQATMGGGDELSLDERTLTDLAGPDQPPVQAPPHVELFLQIHAPDTTALREDRYALVVSGAARAAGATTGRFLHLLDAADRGRFRDAYSAVATMRAGAVPVQLSFPPLQAASDHLACAPSMLPMVLSVGECSDGDQVIRVEDVAVGGDTEGLFLVSLRHRLLIEPTVLNAVEFRFFSHPLARFLCELPRACAAVYMPFSWGAAAALPFLPRLRYRRTVLAPARWNLTAGDLPPADAPRQQWREALVEWRQRLRLPDRVYLVEADNLLPLDLTEELHQELLRAHLDRQGQARLDEAPSDDAYGWLNGHAHEIVIPLTRTAQATAAPSLARVRTVQHDDGHLPGASHWLYAKLYTSADRTVGLVHDVPDLLATWNGPAEWWYLPYRDPDPHLRLRIRLPDADAYGPAAARVGAWATRLQRGRRLGRLQLDTYHPETGRYGHGTAMTAAERVFAADSSAAVAELNAAAVNSVPLDALAAASLVDIVMAFAGETATAMTWLATHLPKETAPSARATHHQAVRLADPTQKWSALCSSINAGPVLDAWQHRRIAVQAYRDQLAAQRDPWSVVPSLLHLHCIRLHDVDPDRERLIRKLTRAVALRWSALHLAEAR